MYSILLVCLINTTLTACSSDSMVLPIQNGRILKDRTDSLLTMHPQGVLISPTDDFVIRSCSDGKVNGVIQFKDESLIIVAASDGKFYTYGMVDHPTVKKGELVSKGSILGRLDNTIGDNNYILFSVSKRENNLNAYRYVIYR